jgi:2-methylisocitrate lyase-like PEP mutase family enzyme
MASSGKRLRELIQAPEILVLPGAWDGLAVREMEAVGTAGIHIEDQVTPKRCGHYEGKEVVDRREFVKKIEAACAARRGLCNHCTHGRPCGHGARRSNCPRQSVP